MIELIEIIEKPELKSRFIKELIRIEHVIKKKPSLANPELFNELENQIHILNHVQGRFGNLIYEDEFLKTLRQIHHPNTKECEFNSPHLIMWFDLDPKVRQNNINQWLNCLSDLESTVGIYLSLLKETTEYIPILVHNGFYQYNLSAKPIHHLILLKMPKSLKLTPTLQIGHHNLIIRLHKLASMYEIHDETVEMEIAFCQI
jgi:cell division protein ZapD